MDDHIDSTRYPVGPMPRIRELDAEARSAYLSIIEGAPETLRSLVTGLADPDLERTYRPGGWTVRQLVHHLADSHINAYVRAKLAATEDLPIVKSWEEKRWAELPEARSGEVEMSLALLAALHRRWVTFLRAIGPEDLRRAFRHYEWGEVTIDATISMYAWHCRHHTAHVALALGKRI
jgi:DinB family protein